MNEIDFEEMIEDWSYGCNCPEDLSDFEYEIEIEQRL